MQRRLGIAVGAMVAATLATALAAQTAQAARTAADASPSTVSPLDAMLACGKQVFKRPVYVTSDSRYFGLRFPCPSTPAAFAEAVSRDELRVIESEKSVILTPEWRYTNPLFKYEWARATVQTIVSQGSLQDGAGRQLRPEEQDAVAAAIVNTARTPPLGLLPPGTPGETVSEEVHLEIVVLPLRKGVESVAAFWGHLNGFRRLVYGELVDGHYVFKWDSPILGGRRPTLSYADVDGDGTAEMAVTSFFGRSSVMVSIFSTEGRELTRQTSCRSDWSERAGDRAAVACPAVGTEITLEEPSKGTRALWVDDRDGGFRMILKNGRYVRARK